MKPLPYYSQQHMAKHPNFVPLTKQTLQFYQKLWEKNAMGKLPRQNPEKLVEEWRQKRAPIDNWYLNVMRE